MKKKVLLIISAVIVLAIVFSFSACRKAAEKVAEQAIEKTVESLAGESVDINVDESTVKVSSEEGEAQFGESAQMPEGWPSVVPVYPDWKITFSSKDSKGVFAVNGEVTKGTVKDVYDWYKSKMSDWEIESENYEKTTNNNDSFSLTMKNNQYEVFIMASTYGKVSLLITVTPIVNQ